MTTVPVRFTDRSRIVKDWTCPRARYLGYEYGGRGITPEGNSLELWMGTTIHDALAAIARATLLQQEVDIHLIAGEARRQMYDSLSQTLPGEIPDEDTRTFAAEQACLVEGLVRGFYRHVWPRLLQRYPRIIAVEQEMTLPLGDGITFMSKPDLILADDEDEWAYIEYKSTSSKRREWVDQWQTAVQLHSGCKAVEHTRGHPVGTVIVQGLYKGYESYGRQNSPFCYAYVRAGNPPFTRDQVQYEYASGFRRQPVWEREGGVREWVAGMPENILADQFPQTPPIFVNEDLIERFLAQVKQREADIAFAVADLERVPERSTENLDIYFPQHFDQCQPGWGRGCAFRRICHGRVDDPLSQGYVWREPHHAPEAEMMAVRDGL